MSIAPVVNEWFARNRRELPWRRDGFGAWGILVSEFMLQQTPVARVLPRLEQWLARWPTPAALASSPVAEALRAWERLGYPRRALNLHATAILIASRHGGVVPSSVEDLLALPGVGEYTARAVAVFAYGERHPVVDTNVRRVIARALKGKALAGAPSIRRDLEAMSMLLPSGRGDARIFNAAMMELGALVCTARSPRCETCPLVATCAWRAAGYPDYDGKRVAAQKKFAGSDRQVRGLVMAELRASDIPVSPREIEQVWPDAEQRSRAIAGLIADGLVVETPDGFELPR